MGQFEVPQFIETESKIIGPLTLKQFGFIAAPSLVCFFLYFTLSLWAWIPVAIVLVSLGIVFALVKTNGRPMYKMALYVLRFFWSPRLFLWKRPVATDVFSLPSKAAHTRDELSKHQQEGSSVSKLWKELVATRNPIPFREKEQTRPSLADVQEQYEVFKRATGEKEVAHRIDYR